SVRGIVPASLGKCDTARREKIAHAVKTRLSIDVRAIVGSEIKRTEGLAGLSRALLKVIVERLLPACRVEAGGIGDDTVEVKENGVVPVAGDHLVYGLPHGRFPPLD